MDFYGWYGEFQITHSVARIVLKNTGLVITSDDASRPFESRPGVLLGD